MNNYLLVNLNMFTLNNVITLVKENSASTLGYFPYDDLPEVIIALSKDYNINKVKFSGFKEYVNLVEPEVREKEKKLYGVNKLEIEVI